MKLAIIGSRNVNLSVKDVTEQCPDSVTEIVSGGARGVDSLAAECAVLLKLKLTEFRPDYKKNGRGATFIRNRQIVDYADEVLAFWDGLSHGTKYTIDYARKHGKRVKIVKVANQ